MQWRARCYLKKRFLPPVPPIVLSIIKWNGRRPGCACSLLEKQMPSYNGQNPNATIAKHIIQHFWETFGRGPNGEFNEVHSICMRWPDLFAFPNWLYPRMFEAMKILNRRSALLKHAMKPTRLPRKPPIRWLQTHDPRQISLSFLQILRNCIIIVYQLSVQMQCYRVCFHFHRIVIGASSFQSNGLQCNGN
ncbi:hypothetical protein BDZ89DRAFT_1111716, partial [Hymenopellis radicata]